MRAVYLFALLVLSPLVSAAPLPVDSSPEAKQAFEDLGAYYADEKHPPEVAATITKLNQVDTPDARAAGKYIAALFRQTFADEDNNRAPLKLSPFWGEGAKNVAREFRIQMAKQLAGDCHSVQAIDAALWLIESDPLAENQSAGVNLLVKIDGPEVEAAFKHLLSPPVHSSAVLAAVSGEVGRRKLTSLAQLVRPLATDYRKPVRDAAIAQAAPLGFKPAPFIPEEAFTPWLEGELRQIDDMVMPDIPPAAKWSRFDQTYRRKTEEGVQEYHDVFGGWQLDATPTSVHLVNWFGREITLPLTDLKISDWTLKESADELSKLRSKSDDDHSFALSQGGGLTGQFEPRAISVPEALVGVWAFTRGDKATAAAVLFPRYDELQDERHLKYIIADILGWHYRDDMLNTFCRRHDYTKAIAIGHHLQKPGFEHYSDRKLVDELTQQLIDRQNTDFNTLTLPTEQQWTEMRKSMDRPTQIKFLLERLRLSNGHYENVGYENDGGYDEDAPATRPTTRAAEPIGPINELDHLHITMKELPLVVPYLGDQDFLQTYGYWRKFHPSRSMSRVNALAADLVRATTVKSVLEASDYDKADAPTRAKMIADVNDFIRIHKDSTAEQLFEAEAADAKEYWDLKYAVKGIAKTNKPAAFDKLLSQIDKYPDDRGEAVEILFAMDAKRLIGPARKLVLDKNQKVKFWSGLALFEAGGSDRAAGMEALTEVLNSTDGDQLYPAAIEDLLSAKDDPAATKLAVSVLDHFGTFGSSAADRRGPILRRMLLAGRPEARDYIVKTLADTTKNSGSAGERNGVSVSRENVVGDKLADDIQYFNNFEFDTLDPDDKRQTTREAMSRWVREQFDLISAGKTSALKPDGWSMKANVLEFVYR